MIRRRTGSARATKARSRRSSADGSMIIIQLVPFINRLIDYGDRFGNRPSKWGTDMLEGSRQEFERAAVDVRGIRLRPATTPTGSSRRDVSSSSPVRSPSTRTESSSGVMTLWPRPDRSHQSATCDRGGRRSDGRRGPNHAVPDPPRGSWSGCRGPKGVLPRHGAGQHAAGRVCPRWPAPNSWSKSTL